MQQVLIQIYEIQTPQEAEAMVEVGVDHIGSVVLSEDDWKSTVLRDTVKVVVAGKAKSSMIPLFSDLDNISRMIDYYRPDIVHFCEDIASATGTNGNAEEAAAVQKKVRQRFPEIDLMRSIPVTVSADDRPADDDELDRMDGILSLFEPISDWFLTDTLMTGLDDQPVSGFVGITGETCNWDIVNRLVQTTKIPVFLAGGISPQNVYDGVLHTRPAGVDSCTRTNADNGKDGYTRFKKDIDKVARFVDEVRRAESEIADAPER